MNYEFGTSFLNIFSFEMEANGFILGKFKIIKKKNQNCLNCKSKTCQDIGSLDVMTQVRNMI